MVGGINTGRVILGGLLAGLVFNTGETILNAVVLAEPMQALAEAHNLTEPGPAAIGVFVVLGFILGIVMVWLYAAVRPRLGPGPKTAAMVGVAVWFFAYVISTAGMVAMGMASANVAALILVWGLVELVLAALAGGWAYKEA
jgi:hypothetical protein